jgi:sec-independent protein translocase protein TatB
VFDIAWGEFLVIAVVALIVIGPKELPAVLRTIGQWTTKIRRMAAEFQGQFQEALREAEMADLKKEVDDAAKGFSSQFDDPLNLKEATKWEPQPDAAKPDDVKPDSAAKSAEVPQESGAVGSEPSAYPLPQAGVGSEGDEAFPVAAAPPAIEQSPAVPSPAGKGGNGGEAAEAAATPPPVAPPLAQPSLSEGSGQRGSEGGVHS